MKQGIAADDHLLANYARAPVTFVRGDGCELIDALGGRYLDFVAGIGVCALGHAHPSIALAIAEQAATLVHCSNLYGYEPAASLADELANLTGFGRVFFCNSGTEANEAAIKLARKSAFRRGEEQRRTILSCTGSFHGRTLGSLAATDNAKYQEGFGPLPGAFEVVPFNDVDALEKRLDQTIAAVLIEPIQGESGVYPADVRFLEAARELCDKHGALLVFDEVQCGVGRTGPFFAFEHYGVRPDVATLAKALANGLPIGAVLIDERLAEVFRPGDHGSTFGGSPVPCAAALAHLRLREEYHLEHRVRQVGAYLHGALQDMHERFPHLVSAPRGAGLMLGLTVQPPYQAGEIVTRALNQNVLINAAGNNSLRFVPPLIIERTHIDQLHGVLNALLAELPPA